MTALEKVRDWIATYPGYSALDGLSVDYTDAKPDNGGLMPGGLTEISRTEDILGNIVVTNQYSFSLYFLFAKSPGDDIGAEANAEWLLAFQDWVQEQSIRRAAPVFGDDARKETIKAQNGTLIGADEEGTACYTVQLTAQFIKKYEYGG